MKLRKYLEDKLTISVSAVDAFDQITQAQAHQVFANIKDGYEELDIEDEEKEISLMFSWDKGPRGMTISGLAANFGTIPESIIRESTVDYHFLDNELVKISQPIGIANVALRDYMRHSAREAAKLRLRGSATWLIKSLYNQLD